MARFSIVMCCQEAEASVGDAIRSCLAQTERDLEVIVVDDGSTDDSARVVADAAAADPRVRLVRQHRTGLAASRRAGLAQARGDLVNFVGAGDLLEPEKLEIQGSVLMENPQTDLVLCDGTLVDGAGRLLDAGLIEASHYAGHAPLFDIWLRTEPCPASIPLVRYGLAAAAAGASDPSRGVWSDCEFWMRVAAARPRYHVVNRRLVRHARKRSKSGAEQHEMEAEAGYAALVAEAPGEAARAVRASQRHARDAEVACGQLRRLVAEVAAERDALETEALGLRAANSRLKTLVDGMRAVLLESVVRGSNSPHGRPLLIWGAGTAGRHALTRLHAAGAAVRAVIDSDPAKEGSRLADVPVISPGTLQRADGHRPFVIIASIHAAAIASGLDALGWLEGADYECINPDGRIPGVHA